MPNQLTRAIGGALLFSILLTSCGPYPYHYYRPAADGGELVIWHSNIAGPSNGIILRNDGFEIKVRYTAEIEIELFVPKNRVLTLSIPELYLVGERSSGATYPVSFFEFSNPKEEVTVFTGKPRENILQRDGSVYLAKIDIGSVNRHFTVRLPKFISDSKPVEFADISFSSDSGIAVSPIN